jgi:CBS domain-containing membrane protein
MRDRLVACSGALLGIGLTGVISSLAAATPAGIPLLVGPIGASAVLLFAVPASLLAQPWSIAGGNVISALVGVAVAQAIPETALAAAVAVAAAIAAMSLLRCLHPPGGAVALTVALGGPAIAASGYMFALVPVGLNSVVLVGLGWLFHQFSHHAYPHVPKPVAVNLHGTADVPPQQRVSLTDADIDAALRVEGESFDIARGDLDRLIRRAERAAVERTRQVPRCADIMSRDVVSIGAEAPVSEALALLLAHEVRILPVVDAHRRVAGMVELRDLDVSEGPVREVMTGAMVAHADDSILSLVDPLGEGLNHAIAVAGKDERLQGLITQTDLIVALSRLVASGVAADRAAGA